MHTHLVCLGASVHPTVHLSVWYGGPIGVDLELNIKNINCSDMLSDTHTCTNTSNSEYESTENLLPL